MRGGLNWTSALKAVTLDPARIMGLGEVQGSLTVGKKANAVVWSGDPFEFSSNPQQVFIRGKEVDLSNRPDMLFRRYRRIPQGLAMGN